MFKAELLLEVDTFMEKFPLMEKVNEWINNIPYLFILRKEHKKSWRFCVNGARQFKT